MAGAGGDLAGDLPDRGGSGGGAGRAGCTEGGGLLVGGEGWIGTHATLVHPNPTSSYTRSQQLQN